ncbi:MAG: hypothetical protein QOD25_32 [Alphaproteobacteria bacterium]|jgi:hypothetical protein|nr:hypothetical protein [Alphaproteobacteria bacterium]
MNSAAPLQNQAPKSQPKSQPLTSSTRASPLFQEKWVGGSPSSSLTGQAKFAAGASNDVRERKADPAADQGMTTRPLPQFNFARVPITAPTIQRKPTVSSPGEPLEREADEMADRVMRMVETGPIGGAPAGIQRKCAACGQEEKKSSRSASRQSIEGREEELGELAPVAVQRKAEFSAPSFPTAASSRTIADRLAASKSGGELLTSGTHDSMETAFGRDFSRVRVHRDSDAAALSHQLSAVAFTHGSHIYFGSGRYDPEGWSGKRLLAHELTHVVQQGQAARKSGEPAAPIAAAVQTTAPAIQRAATWAAAALHETNSLANTALDGADAGVTSPTFNGVMFGPLNAPTLNVAAAAGGGFDATVATVPVNAGSVEETVMGPGPWRRVAPKATIRALFPALPQCTGAGNSNFRARGDPTDAAMIAANRRHEDHHAADRRDAFNATVVPWDTRLTTANAAGTTFHGATDAAARAALAVAMGGTAAQISAACLAAGAAARDAFHATAAGGPVGAAIDPTAAPDCSWSFARYHNPS